MNTSTDWFVSWFDSPYYHILYQHRNDHEAQFFMKNLTSFLKIPKGSEILDIPCGRGRHALYLSTLEYQVTGLDLSVNSIDFAKNYENDQLIFDVHDIRNPFPKKYDAILNLFTSFGYFESDGEDIQVLTNFKNALKPNRFAVIDFINIEKTIENLVVDETKTIDGIQFHITKKLENGFLIKYIEINDQGQKQHFYEKVKCIDLNKINNYLNVVGFKLKHTFGNYNLESFDVKSSDRLILVVQ
ncbi:MAG: class I SAM-dependent methyltransferase [Flavobacteriaceae bacterium]|nr:class I SAM-dependent methyltransferase [Flavobacteriaceae bacterium]